MTIIEPKVELWEEEDKVAHVARCARLCYGKDSGNDAALYNSLEKRKHLSMFRHETYYAAIPIKTSNDLVYDCLKGFMYCPYIDWVSYKGYLYIVTNGNFMRDMLDSNPILCKYILDNLIDYKEASNIEPIWKDLIRYTFCVTTQISTSRELNRVSPNNIAERSTRYVYEDGTICRPHWFTKEEADLYNGGKSNLLDDGIEYYLNSCACGFNNYKYLVEFYKLHRQDARGVLPLDTATKCVYTYSIKEWRNIIDLRYYGTTGQPHDNAKVIASMIRDELMNLSYNFREK